jgi:hypothetical protein
MVNCCPMDLAHVPLLIPHLLTAGDPRRFEEKVEAKPLFGLDLRSETLTMRFKAFI